MCSSQGKILCFTVNFESGFSCSESISKVIRTKNMLVLTPSLLLVTWAYVQLEGLTCANFGPKGRR